MVGKGQEAVSRDWEAVGRDQEADSKDWEWLAMAREPLAGTRSSWQGLESG